MHAQLTIEHQARPWADIRQQLAAIFGPHDPKALEESPFYKAQSLAWQALPLYASQGGEYRIICMASWNEELQVVVETDRGNLRRSTQSAWRGIRSVLRDYEPKLGAAEILDFGSGQPVLTGQTGLKTEIARREVWQTLVAGVASIVVVLLGLFWFAEASRFELIAGAAPGLAVAAVTLTLAVRDVRSGRLRWPE